jgi:predicted metalloprotease with PDZ domain
VIVSFFRRSRFLSLFVLLFGFGFCSPLHATIHYHVSLEHPEQHLFHVIMTIPDVADYVVVQIPAWNALYQIRDFSAHIRQVRATVSDTAAERGVQASGNETPAPIEKIDKQTWRISVRGLHGGRGMVTVRYATYWDEPGPFAAQLNREHAFINPAMIVMYVPERRSEDVVFDLTDVPEPWDASGPGIQTREEMGGARRFSGQFQDYDALADAPSEVGKFEEFQLSGIKPEIWVVIHGDNYKKKQVESELKHICEYEIGLLGNAPYRRYTFILHIGKGAAGASGGMEHADGTAINIPTGEYLPGIAAHEFFHLWNVKRIRPATLYPVDYAGEQYTRALWFAEGVTNTYASYTLARSGLWSKQQFYHDLGEQITEMEARPANHWQSVEQSSLDAWLEKYPWYNSGEYSVSYYNKGQILGVLLDILMRDRSDNGAGLDELLRAMDRDFALARRNYRDSADVELTAEKVAGGSFADFFKRYVAGTDPLPYRETLALAGLELRETEHRRATLGFSAEFSPKAGLTVRDVDADGSPAQSGLQSGDIILNWNGADPPKHPNDWLHQQKPGGTLRLRIRRDGVESNVNFRLGEVKEISYDIEESAHIDEKARRIRDGLVRGVTSAAGVRAIH